MNYIIRKVIVRSHWNFDKLIPKYIPQYDRIIKLRIPIRLREKKHDL